MALAKTTRLQLSSLVVRNHALIGVIIPQSTWLYVMRSRKSVGTRTCDIFSFLFGGTGDLKRHILLKTPIESVQWFQGYEQLKGSLNNRKQLKLISFSGYISQSMLLPSD